MAKSANTISKRSYQSKNIPPPDHLGAIEMFEGCMNPKRARDLGNSLIEWAIADNNAQYVVEFLDKRKIIPRTFRDWRKKYPDLQKAYEFTQKVVLNHKRERKASERDNKFFSDTMDMYDRDFAKRKKKEFDQKLKLKAAGATNINNASCKHLPSETDIAAPLICSDGKPVSYHAAKQYEPEPKPD